ncbi:efflux RND transporter periplasmic adaptor subunit [Corticimicrobacter populi]|uniref:Efflux RND transporter periplasmic adaptor subunit n=1 Tax=Corticimicrobacter populi TaxID=2175229 RepID=A0A2V1K0G0_9BURK|nr:efflux RND transporter periplasmic adaptor subunit [Corticimicrobacter populi]PWF22610.1 efflux RND transporter periplasmic adaptor subunit [Corticimicrobacter populi]
MPAARPFQRFRALLCLSLWPLLLTACGQDAAPSTTATRVRLQVVQPDTTQQAGFNLPGTVVARVDSTLSFRVPGRLLARPVDVGAQVGQGTRLAQLDPEPLRLARDEAAAQVAQTQGVLERSRRDVARNRTLVEKGALARADFDALETGLNNAQAQHDAARSRLAQARNNLAYADLSAPQPGIITQVHAEVGQVVAAGTPIISMAYDGQRELEVDVPENDIAQIQPGSTVQARLLSAPDTVLQGRVREISPVADPASRTYRVRVALDAMPDSARLGMTASVQLNHTSTAPAQIFRLPLAALYQQGEGPAVWVLPDGTNHLELRPVTLGSMGTDHIMVTAGLQSGERVVTAGVHRLDAGMPVQPWDHRLP